LLLSLAAIVLTGCPTERAPVKLMTDQPAQAFLVTTDRVTNSTVEEVRDLKPPKWSNTLPRTAGAESTMYSIECLITSYKQEADGDYHLVCQSPESAATIVVEVVDPDCAVGSHALGHIKMVRSGFTRFLEAPKKSGWTTLNPPKKLRIAGPGFFDKPHKQRGVAPNGIEIHPVLHIANPY
jgi:hypothetical protein